MYPRGWFTIAVLIAVFTAGCASSSTVNQQQAMAKLGAQEKQDKLNQQLAIMGSQAASKGSQDYQLGTEDLQVAWHDYLDLGPPQRPQLQL